MGQSSPHNTRVINNFDLRKRLKFAKSNRLVSAVKFMLYTDCEKEKRNETPNHVMTASFPVANEVVEQDSYDVFLGSHWPDGYRAIQISLR